MRTLSIKWFLAALFLSAFIIQSSIFYGFFKGAEQNIVHLLRDNLQAKVLVLKHFLQKNIQENNINNIVTFLDNTAVTSDLIKDIHILDDKGKLLYATDRIIHSNSAHTYCHNIAYISVANLNTDNCFTFQIKLYKGLEPYYYKVYVYTDTHYIHSLLDQQKYKYLLYFLLFTILFLLFFWFLLNRYLATPLNELREYAYYSTQEPDFFDIAELESIRYSLKITFNRLKKEQEELYKLSTQDSLCGLYNRLSLMEKLKWLIDKAQRDNERFAVIFIDLDNFKHINDTKGHDFGDIILQKVASILFETIRKNDFVARFGGDEFVVILPNFKEETLIIDVAQRIQKKLTSLSERTMLTASMGIAIYPKDGHNASTLLKNADIAMYKAKELGKNKYHFFTESLNRIIEEHLHIQMLLRKALKEGNFKLYYQPKVEISTGRIIGCEALLRLIDPKEGAIPTASFISVAEKSGLIIDIGRWVIEEALRQIEKWKDTPFHNIQVSINVSALQFHDRYFIEHLSSLMTHQRQSAKLDIELTESAFIHDIDSSINYLDQIKALGVSLSLDDFGTGYSSLSNLKQIPFNTVKIDKSFIEDITNKKSRSFVEMIINISRILGVRIVAEGVETKEQLQVLQTMECDIYQGYYCSEPLPISEFEALFLDKHCPENML